jgi:hypothetical protein
MPSPMSGRIMGKVSVVAAAVLTPGSIGGAIAVLVQNAAIVSE